MGWKGREGRKGRKWHDMSTRGQKDGEGKDERRGGDMT